MATEIEVVEAKRDLGRELDQMPDDLEPIDDDHRGLVLRAGEYEYWRGEGGDWNVRRSNDQGTWEGDIVNRRPNLKWRIGGYEELP